MSRGSLRSIQLTTMRRRHSGAYSNENFIGDERNQSVPVSIISNHNVNTDTAKEAVLENMENSDPEADEMEFEDDGNEGIKAFNFITRVKREIAVGYESNKVIILRVFYAILFIGFIVYFGFAMSSLYGSSPFPVPNPGDIFENNSGLALLVLTSICLLFIIWDFIMVHCGSKCTSCWDQVKERYPRILLVVKIVIVLLLFAGIGVYLALEVFEKDPDNYVSLLGYIGLLVITFIFSKDPGRVKWNPVIGGVLLQFLFAVFVIRTQFGYDLFYFLGEQVRAFLGYTTKGTDLVFGPNQTAFGFSVLPVIVFFSAIVSVLFYIGAIQYITKKIAWLIGSLLGTTAAESVTTSANIFIGMTEAPLLIKPLLADMTPSELHAVMTGGFATVAGSVLAAYINFGVPANHLIAASVMAAPAALAASKLLYPETKKSRTTWEIVSRIPKPTEKNVIEALSNGASQSIAIVANIAVNLIAFLAILGFLDAASSWLFGNVRHPEITFQKLMAWVYYPLSRLIGVGERDAMMVAELIGTKTVLNEFIAYQRLGAIERLRANMSAMDITNYNGTQDFLYEERSVVISTYALCGFANIGAMGIQIGALGAIVPSKKRALTKLVLTAMIAGNIASFMSASVAGLLYEKNIIENGTSLTSQNTS